MQRSLGVVDVVFAPATVLEAARRAQALGFAHIDVSCDWEGELALPVGDRIAHPSPRPHSSSPAPPEGEGRWERAVRAYRRTPGVRMEPCPGSIVDSVGDVDFAAVFRRLERLDYRGRLSVEYFDLPDMGWGLDDPVGYAVALAAQLRPLLGVNA